MPTFIRVENRETGAQYDIDERSFDSSLHTKVNASAQYPDLTGDLIEVRPAKPRTDKAGQPATTKKES